MNFKKLIFMFPLLLAMSCHHEPRRHSVSPVSSCTATTMIQYSTCSATSGCTLSFSCPTSSVNSKVQRFLALLPGNFDSQNSIFKADSSSLDPTLTISSIIINQPALLQATPGTAPTNWYNNSIACTVSGTSVTCPLFAPIASDFTIQGTLGTQNLTLNVTVEDDLTPGVTTTCGQGSTTTVQRMFDCSQRITDFAGFGNGNGTFTAFVPGNPDPNWFLVSCPGTDNQECFWLSPVMSTTASVISSVHTAYPALASDEYDSNSPIPGNAMSSYNGGRFLWSGRSVNTYNFFQANGNNSYNATNQTNAYYNFYAYQTDTTMAVLHVGGGPIIYQPNSSDTPVIYSGYSSAYALATNSQSVCQIGSDPLLLSGSAYKWQMPSYPMIMTLTGGTGTGQIGNDCDTGVSGNDYDDGNAVYCNIGSSPKSVQGFRAIDPVPGFDSTNTVNSTFWSSSVFDSYDGWLFDGGGNGYPGSADNVGLVYGIFVRCVSSAW